MSGQGGRRRGNSAVSPYLVPSKSISSPGGFKRMRGKHLQGGGAQGGPRDIFSSKRRRGNGLGSFSRRRPIPWVPLALAALVVAGIAAGAWFLTRPTTVAIAAQPADARITFGPLRPQAGRVATTGLEPGPYRLRIERTGFASLTTTVTLGRGQRLERTFALPPLPQSVTVSSLPSGAAVRVVPASGEPITGVTPLATTLPAGRTTLTLTAKDGSATARRSLFVDSASSIGVVLDPAGQLVANDCFITTSAAPKSVSITPNGSQAWTALLNGPPSIEIHEPKTGRKLGSLDLGTYGAVEVVFNRAGTLAFASQMETAKVFMIDVKTRKVLREFATHGAGTRVVALSPDEKTLYAADWSSNDVSVIDIATGQVVKRVPVAKSPRGLWPTANGRYLFVAGFATGDIQRIDLTTWKADKVFRSGGALRDLVGDDKRGLLFASDMSKDVIWVTDMATLKTRQFAKVDHKPNTIALSPDSRVLFVSCRGANNPKSYYIPGFEWGTVLLLDAATGKPLDAIVGGNQCTALAVSSDGRTLVFSDFLDNRLRVYAVPPYAKLAAGGGGLYQAHFAMLVKKTAGTAAAKSTPVPDSAGGTAAAQGM
jgi:YVTN family beta-propeller protein